MKVSAMNWLQMEEYLGRDDRAVVPLGSTEEHAYLSLAVDNILAERVSIEAAEPLGVPVFPTLNYGLTPYFLAYPGTVSLKLETYAKVLQDVLDSLAQTGFRRVLFVNGHGGNSHGQGVLQEWMNRNPGVQVRWYNWWNAPRTFELVKEIDPVASHASWMEDFTWTRVDGVERPGHVKPLVDMQKMRLLPATEVRALVGDGSLGGAYYKDDETMGRIWQAGVEETRDAIEGPWL